MREGGQAGIDRPRELVAARIAMAGRHADLLSREKPHRRQAFVALRGERDEPHEAAAGVEQPACRRRARRHDMRGRMGPDVAGAGVDEGALDVNTGHDGTDIGIGRMQLREPGDPCRHRVEPVGDDGREHPAAAVGPHGRAGLPQGVEREVVGVEVDTLIAVELQVKHGKPPPCRGMMAGAMPLRDRRAAGSPGVA